MFKKIILVAALLTLVGCAGVRTTEKSYSAHAENLNFLFMRIPGGDTHNRAMALVPQNGEITTIKSERPMDTDSFWGVMNRMLGFDVTIISGTVNDNGGMVKESIL